MFKTSDTQNLLNLHNVFNSGVIDKAVPFPIWQEWRQLLGDQKIYAVCEMCLTDKKQFIQKRERLTGKEKSHGTE